MLENLNWESICVVCGEKKTPTNCTDYLNEAKKPMLENKSIPHMQTPYLSQYKILKIYK